MTFLGFSFAGSKFTIDFDYLVCLFVCLFVCFLCLLFLFVVFFFIKKSHLLSAYLCKTIHVSNYSIQIALLFILLCMLTMLAQFKAFRSTPSSGSWRFFRFANSSLVLSPASGTRSSSPTTPKTKFWWPVFTFQRCTQGKWKQFLIFDFDFWFFCMFIF